MSVIGTAQELPDSPSGQLGESEHSFTRKFLVETSSFGDGPIVAISAAGIPPLFSTYAITNEFHLYARVRNIQAERAAPNSLYWVVECEYQTKSEEDEDEDDNPLAALPEIRLGFTTKEEIVIGELTGSLKDAFSNGIKNSADEVFENPPTRTVSQMVLTITRNEAVTAAHPATALSYVDTVSSGAFFGQDAKTARMVGISVDRQVKQLKNGGVFPYLKSSYNIQFKDEGWKVKLLDHGSYYKDIQDNKISFKTEEGAEPYLGLLDGSGGKLAGAADPVYLAPLQIYTEKDWSGLGLPSSFTEGR